MRNDQIDNHLPGPSPARATPPAKVELLSDEPAMPAQQGIRRDDCAELEQHLSRDPEGSSGKQGPLRIREAQGAALEAFAQHSVLRLQVLDDD